MMEKIVEQMHAIASENRVSLRTPLTGDSVLLDSGLDSLAFAILIARLEEDLGYDPFTMMDEPVYPRTLGELVAIYVKYAP